MSVLRVENLSVDLGGRSVLRHVDLQVDAGEFVALLGPNGAGKTTLLRSILALVRGRSGRVLINGALARPGRTAVGYVPQRHEFAWDFPISVEHAVMSGRSGHLGLFSRPGVADWRAVGAAVERVHLGDLRSRPVGELSGGQRQRVLVARALALEPDILLLDEPFTGLDLPTQELLDDLFAVLARQKAVLMTTHDLAAALESCSRLVLLNETVVADGPPADLRDPDVWMQTFGMSSRSPLLRMLGTV